MKISVSLPAEDVAFLDEYARHSKSGSRSAAIHQAIGLLRSNRLEAAYASAFDEWDDSEDARLWDRVVADGTTADGSADASW